MKSFKLTTVSCFIGISVQAVIATVTAILFIPLKTLYGLSYVRFGILIALNYGTQFLIDIIFSGVIDRIGYKRLVLPACVLSFIGLSMFALTPFIFNNVYVGFIISTVIFSASGGLLEILLSPIVNAISKDGNGKAMSLMHSFYSWGQVVTVIITTLFIFIAGAKSWQIIVGFWAIFPLIDFIMFSNSPFPETVPEEKRDGAKIFKKPFFIVCLIAICFGGATEIVINQWISAFLEKGLGLSKVVGDLTGLAGFAAMMGLGRALYGKFGDKFNMQKVLILLSALSVICYLGVALSPFNAMSVVFCILCGFAVSLLWPGTIVVASKKYPLAGAMMFAMLAFFGDLGATFSPYITGAVIDGAEAISFVSILTNAFNITAEQGAIRFGILVSVIFPLITLIGHVILYYINKKEELPLKNN